MIKEHQTQCLETGLALGKTSMLTPWSVIRCVRIHKLRTKVACSQHIITATHSNCSTFVDVYTHFMLCNKHERQMASE